MLGRPDQSTRVTFPRGDVEGKSRIIAARQENEDYILVFIEETPFHPVDHLWPDQPEDRGYFEFERGVICPVSHCYTAAYNPATQELLVDKAIVDRGIKRKEQGWIWLVAHRLDVSAHKRELNAETLLGRTADLKVDEPYREAICRGHSLCHLAAFALNEFMEEHSQAKQVEENIWRRAFKKKDSLGRRQFDGATNRSSEIRMDASVDEYEINVPRTDACGKFNVNVLVKLLATLGEGIQKKLNAWLHEDGIRAVITPEVCSLHEVREWVAEKVGQTGKFKMTCGGSHALCFQLPPETRVSTKITQIKPQDGGDLRFRMENSAPYVSRP